MGLLSKDLQLLEQLLDATGDMEVAAERGTLSEALQALVRVLEGRLAEACQYAPLPMGDVVELSARLRWAADEAIRLYPELAEGLNDEAVA